MGSVGQPERQEILVFPQDPSSNGPEKIADYPVYKKFIPLTLTITKEKGKDSVAKVPLQAFAGLLDPTNDDLNPKKGVVIQSITLHSYSNTLAEPISVRFEFKTYRFNGRKPPEEYGVMKVKTASRLPLEDKVVADALEPRRDPGDRTDSRNRASAAGDKMRLVPPSLHHGASSRSPPSSSSPSSFPPIGVSGSNSNGDNGAKNIAKYAHATTATTTTTTTTTATTATTTTTTTTTATTPATINGGVKADRDGGFGTFLDYAGAAIDAGVHAVMGTGGDGSTDRSRLPSEVASASPGATRIGISVEVPGGSNGGDGRFESHQPFAASSVNRPRDGDGNASGRPGGIDNGRPTDRSGIATTTAISKTITDEASCENDEEVLEPIQPVRFKITFQANTVVDCRTLGDDEMSLYKHQYYNVMSKYVNFDERRLDPSAQASTLENADNATGLSLKSRITTTTPQYREVHRSGSMMHELVFANLRKVRGRTIGNRNGPVALHEGTSSRIPSVKNTNRQEREAIEHNVIEYIASDVQRPAGMQGGQTGASVRTLANGGSGSSRDGNRIDDHPGSVILAKILVSHCEDIRERVRRVKDSIGYVDVRHHSIDCGVTVPVGIKQTRPGANTVTFVLDVSYLLVPFVKNESDL